MAMGICSSSSPLYEVLKQRIRVLELEKLAPKERYSKLLLEHATSIDARVQKIEELLELGADIDHQDSAGFTILMHVLDLQNDRIAEYLLCKGADPLIKNKYDRTASDLVSRNSDIYRIIKGYELLTATFRDDLLSIKTILSNDSSLIDFQGVSGDSALLIAVRLKQIHIVEYLLSQNPNLILANNKGVCVFDVVQDKRIEQLLKQANMPETVDDEIEIEQENSRSPRFF